MNRRLSFLFVITTSLTALCATVSAQADDNPSGTSEAKPIDNGDAAAKPADEWVGHSFVPKENCRPRAGDKEIPRNQLPLPYTVRKVNGDWLLVGRAWVHKTEVVPLDKAEAYYTEHLLSHPGSGWAYAMRGIVRDAHGELDHAIDDYSAAIVRDRTIAPAYANRGVAWQKKGELAKAIDDYTEAIGVDSKFWVAYSNRAWVRATAADAKFRDGEQAVTDAIEAAELTEWKDPMVLDTLAAAYAEAGQLDLAVRWQQYAHDLLPDERRGRLAARLKLYQSGQPYREEQLVVPNAGERAANTP